VPEENFWTLWCKGRLTEADTPTIRLGATPSRLTSAHLHHPPIFFTGRMPFLPPNQQRRSTGGNHAAESTMVKVSTKLMTHICTSDVQPTQRKQQHLHWSVDDDNRMTSLKADTHGRVYRPYNTAVLHGRITRPCCTGAIWVTLSTCVTPVVHGRVVRAPHGCVYREPCSRKFLPKILEKARHVMLFRQYGCNMGSIRVRVLTPYDTSRVNL